MREYATIIPFEQVGISLSEFLPGWTSSQPFAAFVDKKQVGPGDRLVIQIRSAVRAGKPPQSSREPRQRVQQGILGKIQPRHPNVIAMVKILGGQRAVLETRHEFNVVHNFNLSGITRQAFDRTRLREDRDYCRDVDDQRAFKLSMRQMNEHGENKYGHQ